MELFSDRRRVGTLNIQEIEYLEVSKEGGDAYINTLCIPKGEDIDIYCNAMLKGHKSDYSYGYIFAAQEGSDHVPYRVYYNPNIFEISIGIPPSRDFIVNNVPYNQVLRMKFLKDRTYEINDINGTLPEWDTSLLENRRPLLLFSSDGTTRFMYGRIYSFRVDKADKTILDLIPVRVGNEGFMYDKVSGKLYGNSGDGRFILGPDVTKPYDKEVEYLEVNEGSNGFIDINTGYIPSEGDNVISLKFTHLSFKAGSDRAVLFSNQAIDPATERRYRINQQTTSTNMYNIYNGSLVYSFYASSNSTHSIEMYPERGFYTINNNSFNTNYEKGLQEAGNPIHLFGEFSDDYTPVNPNVRIYYFKWYKAGELVLDLIPVRKGNAGYLYNRVNGELLGNSGDGHFIVGPDIN